MLPEFLLSGAIVLSFNDFSDPARISTIPACQQAADWLSGTGAHCGAAPSWDGSEKALVLCNFMKKKHTLSRVHQDSPRVEFKACWDEPHLLCHLRTLSRASPLQSSKPLEGKLPPRVTEKNIPERNKGHRTPKILNDSGGGSKNRRDSYTETKRNWCAWACPKTMVMPFISKGCWWRSCPAFRGSSPSKLFWEVTMTDGTLHYGGIRQSHHCGAKAEMLPDSYWFNLRLFSTLLWCESEMYSVEIVCQILTFPTLSLKRSSQEAKQYQQLPLSPTDKMGKIQYSRVHCIHEAPWNNQCLLWNRLC